MTDKKMTEEEIRETLDQLCRNRMTLALSPLVQSAEVQAAASLRQAIDSLESLKDSEHPHITLGTAKRALEIESLTFFYEQMLDRLAKESVAVRDHCSCTQCKSAHAQYN